MRRFFALPLAALLTVTAWAHNGMEHVMGTIAAVRAASLDVKTTAGPVKTVLLDDKTTWMRGKTAIKPGDVHAGDRVVIHAKPVNGKLLAAEVELGGAK